MFFETQCDSDDTATTETHHCLLKDTVSMLHKATGWSRDVTFLRYHRSGVRDMLLSGNVESHEQREYTLLSGFNALQRWDRFMNRQP